MGAVWEREYFLFFRPFFSVFWQSLYRSYVPLCAPFGTFNIISLKKKKIWCRINIWQSHQSNFQGPISSLFTQNKTIVAYNEIVQFKVTPIYVTNKSIFLFLVLFLFLFFLFWKINKYIDSFKKLYSKAHRSYIMDKERQSLEAGKHKKLLPPLAKSYPIYKIN